MSSTTSRESRLSRLTTATLLSLSADHLNDYEKTPLLGVNGHRDAVHCSASQTEYYDNSQIEQHVAIMFSDDHLKHILETPPELLKFTAFLKLRRPESVHIFVYYLDVLKALKALSYANAVLDAVGSAATATLTAPAPRPILSWDLEERAASAFQRIVEEDLPAYITQAAVSYVANKLNDQVAVGGERQHYKFGEGLAEMFFLTDPSKPGNPIVFTSDAFERVTAYDKADIKGQSIRILQGMDIAASSIHRIEQACHEGREHCDVLLCSSRSGALFLGLLMISPLCDSRGQIRYYLGALNDISNFGERSENLGLFRNLLHREQGHVEDDARDLERPDELKELSEMFSMTELLTIQRWGGQMHGDHQHPKNINFDQSSMRTAVLPNGDWTDHSHESDPLPYTIESDYRHAPYQDYLLLRPFPSLRIIFASPSLRLPGVLQSPFLSRIGGSRRVREGLTGALAEGRSVTAKISLTINPDEEERMRWVHCTPLRGQNGRIGAWMALLIEDYKSAQREYHESWITPRASPQRGSPLDSDWNGVLWRENDDESDDERPRTSRRISNGTSWADCTSFRSFGTDDASSIDSGSRFNLRVY